MAVIAEPVDLRGTILLAQAGQGAIRLMNQLLPELRQLGARGVLNALIASQLALNVRVAKIEI